MPSINKHLQTYYTPSNINQYKEVLESFEWNLWLSKENYYPSLDSIHRFLFQLTINGKEWEETYYQISNQKLKEYNEKVVKNEVKVVKKNVKRKEKSKEILHK